MPCSRYVFQLSHIFYPPAVTFDRDCLSYDKTYLFIGSLFRFFIYLFIVIILDYEESMKNTLTKIIYYIAVSIAILNFVILIYVMSKYPEKSKYEQVIEEKKLGNTNFLSYDTKCPLPPPPCDPCIARFPSPLTYRAAPQETRPSLKQPNPTLTNNILALPKETPTDNPNALNTLIASPQTDLSTVSPYIGGPPPEATIG